jgi:glyoxylase-like metal-dependent hydrolase (beta-lactamase superfamily II)
MPRYSFIARMPNRPGVLHNAAGVVMRGGGNINRLQFDQRIDPHTVFFEVTCDETAYLRIEQALAELGYLQNTLRPLNVLKFYTFLPNEPGALHEFLNNTTSCQANISSIDFDDRGGHPDRLTVTLSLEESIAAERLLDALKSRYRIEIIEYDTTGKSLDHSVFYLRFAQQIREIVGASEDQLLFRVLGDLNHAAQELMNLGQDPDTVFESILSTGRTLRATTGDGFFADVQVIPVAEDCLLTCIQPPAGGSVYLLRTPEGITLIDTGYGIYARDIRRLMERVIPGCRNEISRVVITHADADHCGAGGDYDVPVLMHPGTLEIIRAANRAYGSRSEASVLEEIYTTMINLFSRFNPPDSPSLFLTVPLGEIAGFPVIADLEVGSYRFRVLEGLGGHLYGQIYLYCRELGLLFSADTVINFGHLSPARAEYNTLAVNLVISVNVDSVVAKTERQRLLGLARDTAGNFYDGRTGCLVCGGHAPVSILSGNTLVPYGRIEHIAPCD